MAPRCATCDFWVRRAPLAGHLSRFGECRRYPPMREPLPNTFENRFPWTPDDYWCGEHKPVTPGRDTP